MDSIRECSVEGCPTPRDARGYCPSHYNRWKRYGDPLGSPAPRERRVCEIDSCDRKSRNWGLCNMHGQRFYKHGDPLAVKTRTRSECSVDGCSTPAKGRGYCAKHLSRLKNAGSPHVVRNGGRPTKGDHPGWSAIHLRVRNARGRAATHACVDCLGEAAEWSYDNADPNELIDVSLNIPYSLSIEHYQPRCIPCHRAFDARARKGATAHFVLTITELKD